MTKIKKIKDNLPSASWLSSDDDRPTVSVVLSLSVDQAEEHDHDSEWCCRPDTDTRYHGVSVHPTGRTPARQKFKKGDTAYVVLARYSTGDTFGQDTGCVEMVGVEADEDAAELLAIAAREAKDFRFEFEGWNYHANWVGYFEHLDEIFVEKVTVSKGVS